MGLNCVFKCLRMSSPIQQRCSNMSIAVPCELFPSVQSLQMVTILLACISITPAISQNWLTKDDTYMQAKNIGIFCFSQCRAFQDANCVFIVVSHCRTAGDVTLLAFCDYFYWRMLQMFCYPCRHKAILNATARQIQKLHCTQRTCTHTYEQRNATTRKILNECRNYEKRSHVSI